MGTLNWFYLINLACVFFSWHVAQRCEQYSRGWWFNMIASALNGAIIIRALI
jgi:hypothetical protein